MRAASVTELAEPFAMSQPAISGHLEVLERAGPISRGRDAQRRPCRMEVGPLVEATASIERWMLGPPGWTMPVCEIDLRVGGQYRHVWRNTADGSEFGFTGEYREIDSPGRLVAMLAQTIRFATPEARDRALQTGMTDGMGASYDRLETLMDEQKVSRA